MILGVFILSLHVLFLVKETLYILKKDVVSGTLLFDYLSDFGAVEIVLGRRILNE